MKLSARIFFFFLILSQNLFSQSEVVTYARTVLDTLCSPWMNGRGYVGYGDKLAARYILGQFQKNKLKTFGDRYVQEFSFPVNVILSAECSINDKKLLLGKDFLPSPFSGNINKTFKAGKAKIQLTDNLKNINPSKKNDLVIQTTKKLTHDISQQVEAIPEIIVLDSSFSMPIKKVKLKVKSQLQPKNNSSNIVGYIMGNQTPDSLVVFTAHFDHLGRIGDAYFPGANDNASGVAMLLSLMNYYAKPGNTPKYSVAFIAFAGEEVGLLGSSYFVEHPMFSLQKIKFLVNLDILGTGDEGITVVNATEHKNEFEKLLKINEQKKYLTAVKPRGVAANSDHYPFHQKGVKTFFIYTMGGIKAYHDIYDKSETLPLTEFDDLYHLLVDFVNDLGK